MPIEINLVETEGFRGDTSLNGQNSAFQCRETGVAQRLAKILQQAEKNNRGKEDFPPTSSRYLANIHYPVFQKIPQSFYVNETAAVGSPVFQVRIFIYSLWSFNTLVCRMGGSFPPFSLSWSLILPLFLLLSLITLNKKRSGES